MKKATILLMLLTILNSSGLEAGSRSSVPEYMYNAANEFGIDVGLMYAICKVESNCHSKAINADDGNEAQKSRGIIDPSYGMFQIKLATAKGLGFKVIETFTKKIVKNHKTVTIQSTINHKNDLFKPEVNAWYAAKLLNHLYKRYGNDTKKVLSAYNAGRYTTANNDYVLKVLNNYANYKRTHRF